MGYDGRQWDTLVFRGLRKSFCSATKRPQSHSKCSLTGFTKPPERIRYRPSPRVPAVKPDIEANLCSVYVLFLALGLMRPKRRIRDLAEDGWRSMPRKVELVGARRPVSRVLYPPAVPHNNGSGGRWPFIWDARYRTPRATYPDGGAGTRLPATPRGAGRRAIPTRSCSRWGLPCHPRLRGRGALLPHPFTLAVHCRSAGRRFAFCGTFPGVAPAGRYPAPCSRGARTFLPRRANGEGGHPAVWQRKG